MIVHDVVFKLHYSINCSWTLVTLKLCFIPMSSFVMSKYISVPLIHEGAANKLTLESRLNHICHFQNWKIEWIMINYILNSIMIISTCSIPRVQDEARSIESGCKCNWQNCKCTQKRRN